jgi:hypothetical protein
MVFVQLAKLLCLLYYSLSVMQISPLFEFIYTQNSK